MKLEKGLNLLKRISDAVAESLSKAWGVWKYYPNNLNNSKLLPIRFFEISIIE